MGPAPNEVRARIAAVNGAYEALWADFLRNRASVAAERAAALLQVLGAVPESSKDADLWVTEADYNYILGAASGNDGKALEAALSCYDRVLSFPGGGGAANARRMRAETLLRLRRYDEAFGAMAELSVLPEAAPFGQLEAAPFRMRHDACLCERLVALGRLPAERGAHAARVLRAVSDRVEAKPLPGRQRWPRVEQLSTEDQADLKEGLFGELMRVSAVYPADRFDTSCSTPASGSSARSPPEPLNSGIDWGTVEREYLEAKITVVDDFFTAEALEELWRYSTEAASFRTVRNGFLGAFPADGNVHPLILATVVSLEQKMHNVMANHPLGLWWLFKYTEAGKDGIGIHADAAAVNFNIWLSPDEARRSGGGLDVFMEVPPVESSIAEINGEFPTVEAEAAFRDTLMRAGEMRHVDYRRNRAVIFVSDLWHASEPFEFPDPVGQPRVNLTLLFGDRFSLSAPVVGKLLGGAQSTSAKRPRDEAEGWDLFD